MTIAAIALSLTKHPDVTDANEPSGNGIEKFVRRISISTSNVGIADHRVIGRDVQREQRRRGRAKNSKCAGSWSHFSILHLNGRTFLWRSCCVRIFVINIQLINSYRLIEDLKCSLINVHSIRFPYSKGTLFFLLFLCRFKGNLDIERIWICLFF